MRVIKANGTKIALLFGPEDIKEGLTFFTENRDSLQVGSWRYGTGKRLEDHTHNYVKREIDRTQEFAYVIKGRMKAFIYDEGRELIEEAVLKANEGIILFSGGHGYEILDDDTVIIEVKTGPFVSVKSDKKKFLRPPQAAKR